MARNARTPRTAHTVRLTNGNAALPAFADVLRFNADVTRTMLDSSSAMMRGWLEYAEQVRRANADVVDDFSTGVRAAVDQAGHASNLSELMSVQRTLASDQLIRASNRYGTLLVQLLGVQSRLMEDARSAAVARSRA
jgi:hypothetical protein